MSIDERPRASNPRWRGHPQRFLTHHFTVEELVALLEAEGFGQISVTTERESSSRRPEEAAYFLYATCR